MAHIQPLMCALRVCPQALGRDDKIDHVYRDAAYGVAGTFTPDTFEHLLEHAHVTDLHANCATHVPEEDDISNAEDMNTTIHDMDAMGVQSGPTWGIDRIDSARGVDSHYDDGSFAGKGSIVYVFDTGIRIDHKEFTGGRAPAQGWSPSGCKRKLSQQPTLC